jgi:hypothetical protein
VLIALRLQPGNASLQVLACDALGALCEDMDTTSEDAVAAGAMELVIAAMCAHRNQEDVQRNGCYALRTMVPANMSGARGRTKGFSVGAVEAVVAAMRAHTTATTKALQRNGADALVHFAYKHDGNLEKACRAGAIEVVIAALAAADGCKHKTLRRSLHESTCAALNALIAGSKPRQDAAIRAGALQALPAEAELSAKMTGAVFHHLIRQLNDAARRHDAKPCKHAGCKRCAAKSATTCALACCGALKQEDGTQLLHCSRCLAAAYCCAAHQRADWRRHKKECQPSTPPPAAAEV